MPRQLLSPWAPAGSVNTVAPLDKGGTGASTPEGAVTNLGGISRNTIGEPGGLLEADRYGHLPMSYLTAAGITVGYALEGPARLVHNQTFTFFMTNYNTQSPIEVSVDVGSVVQVNDEIRVTAPATGESLTLTVGNRTLVLPVHEFSPLPPELLYPTQASDVQMSITAYSGPFQSGVDIYGPWVVVNEENGVQAAIPDGVIAIECDGRKGVAGVSQLELGSTLFSCGTSSTRRRVVRSLENQATFYISGSGSMRYRFIYPAAVHVSTDWQLSSDENFINIVKESLNDTVHLTAWPLELTVGAFYLRSRFNGRAIE